LTPRHSEILVAAFALPLAWVLTSCDGACSRPARPVGDAAQDAPEPDGGPARDGGDGDDPPPPARPLALAFGGPGEDRAHAVDVARDGAVVVVGGFQGEVDLDPGAATELAVARGVVDAFVLRVAADGTHLWSRTFGGPGLDEARAVAVAHDGSSFVAGVFQGTMDLDPGPEDAERTSQGDVDIFVTRLDERGEATFGLSLGGPGSDHAHGVAVTEGGGALVVGRFQGTVDFDPGEETTELRSAGLDDAFVLALAPSGQLRWARAISGPGLVQARSVAVRPDGTAVVTGLFTDRVDLDPGEDTLEQTSAGRSDVFVVALDREGALLWACAFGGAEADYGLASGPGSGPPVAGARIRWGLGSLRGDPLPLW